MNNFFMKDRLFTTGLRNILPGIILYIIELKENVHVGI